MASTTLTKTVREFTDIDLNFIIHPVKKDINILKNEKAIINAVKNIILTNHYEKPFFPDYGSNVRKLLFENVDITITAALENEIRQCLKNFEPRITIISANVIPNFDSNSFNVRLQFYVTNITEPLTIEFTLQRLR